MFIKFHLNELPDQEHIEEIILKIARLMKNGNATYGIVNDGRVYTKQFLEQELNLNLPAMIAEFSELLLSNSRLQTKIKNLINAARQKKALALKSVKLIAPIDGRPKVICVGLNYKDHAKEQGVKPPDEPVIFMKPYTAIIGPTDAIEHPSFIKKLDYEAELGVVIGKRCRGISKNDVDDCILGYTAFDDVSARDVQFKDGQWTRGKSFDTFAPIGPWIVTADEITNPHNLKIISRVNGEIRQNSNTGNMIFKVNEIVSFVSRVMTLDAGDIIATGTPSGVGIFIKPKPKLLNVGDIVEIEIEKVGKLRNPVVTGRV